jgi:hypothetical protein
MNSQIHGSVAFSQTTGISGLYDALYVLMERLMKLHVLGTGLIYGY